MNIRQLFFFFVSLSSSSAWAQDHPTWCARSERELFSCTFSNKKVASLCATPDWARSFGGLQYRFGRLENRRPEMTYPKVIDPFTTFRVLGTERLLPKGDERSIWVSFRVGKFRYVIQDDELHGVHRQVIKVEPDDKPTQTLVCEKNSILLSHQAEKIYYLLDEDEFDER